MIQYDGGAFDYVAAATEVDVLALPETVAEKSETAPESPPERGAGASRNP